MDTVSKMTVNVRDPTSDSETKHQCKNSIKVEPNDSESDSGHNSYIGTSSLTGAAAKLNLQSSGDICSPTFSPSHYAEEAMSSVADMDSSNLGLSSSPSSFDYSHQSKIAN